MLFSLRSPAQQHNLYSVEHDEQIQAEGGILDIKQIVLQLLARIFQSISVLITDLRPAGYPGTYRISHLVIRNFAAQPLHELRPLRARTDKRHVALENTPHLRDFIQPGSAQKAAESGNTRI